MVRATDILAEEKSTIMLSNGKAGRKGSIAATLKNIEVFTRELTRTCDCPSQELNSAISDQRELLPVLHELGLMHLFSPEEWLQDDKALGRILFTLLYLQAYPERLSDRVRARMKVIRTWGNPILKKF